MANVLIIAAHPDDELLGAGGTLVKHVDNGYDVYVVIMSEGASSRYDDKMKYKLKEAAYSAANVIGIQDVYFCDMPDQRMDGMPLLDVVKPLERFVEQVNPEIIYVHHPGDVNQDHQVVFNATMIATRPGSGNKIEQILCYETPSSTEWAAPFVDKVFTPNVFVNIKDSIERKIEAFKCYDSEVRKSPHPRSVEVLRNRAKVWGSKVGLEYAEAFELVRWIR
jgi:LmbE family N-acetylglucosaminyl deacetylase